MRLLMLGIPHTVCNLSHSHCAYSNKTRLWAPMMRAQGFHVIYFGNEGMQSGANEDVTILSREEHLQLLGVSDYHLRPRRLVGDDALSESACYQQFNFTLREELKARLEPGDILCLPFGLAHDAALQGLPLLASGAVARIETGIGYSQTTCLARVYESEAWRHWMLGYEAREGMGWETPRLEWVIPNYYDLAEWPFTATLTPAEQRTVVFFGRVEPVKGVTLIPILARARPDLHFVLCGQGDPEPYLTEPNIEYREPISGAARSAYLGRAGVAIFPSRFVEPFCGAAVEAMLCGTAVLGSSFGAFTETIIQGVNGFRCGGWSDWLAHLDQAVALDRAAVRETAVRRYSMAVIGPQYARVFEMLQRSMELREHVVLEQALAGYRMREAEMAVAE